MAINTKNSNSIKKSSETSINLPGINGSHVISSSPNIIKENSQNSTVKKK